MSSSYSFVAHKRCFHFEARYVRFKAWKGRDPENEEPPSEVKNILRPVVLWRYEDIKAWLCKPSVSVIRGEIMTPDSSYDCRIKLRAGINIIKQDFLNIYYKG